AFALRERQHVGRTVPAAPRAIELVHHRVGHQDERQLGRVEVEGAQEPARAPREPACEGGHATTAHGDEHRHPSYRSERSYAPMISCTSGWRTTSRSVKVTNRMPSMSRNSSCASLSPDCLPAGRSICVTSPVTTAFEPYPSRVRNIF